MAIFQGSGYAHPADLFNEGGGQVSLGDALRQSRYRALVEPEIIKAQEAKAAAATPVVPPEPGAAGTPTQPANPFYFGPNSGNPDATIANPAIAGSPVNLLPNGNPATPEQGQLQQLEAFFQQLQDPVKRLQIVSTLGQTQPAPQDTDIQQFLTGIGIDPESLSSLGSISLGG